MVPGKHCAILQVGPKCPRILESAGKEKGGLELTHHSTAGHGVSTLRQGLPDLQTQKMPNGRAWGSVRQHAHCLSRSPPLLRPPPPHPGQGDTTSEVTFFSRFYQARAAAGTTPISGIHAHLPEHTAPATSHSLIRAAPLYTNSHHPLEKGYRASRWHGG